MTRLTRSTRPGPPRRWIALLAPALAAAALACERAAPPTPPAAAPLRLRVSIQSYLSYLPVVIAQDEGYYRAHGLEVEFAPLSTSEILVALLGDQLDVGILRASPAVFNAILRGGRLQIVADKGKAVPGACPSVSFVARRGLAESGRLTHPRDLSGLRVALSPDAVEQYYCHRLLERGGLTLDDIVQVELSGEAKAEGLAHDLVDLVVANEPMASSLVERGVGSKWMPIFEFLPDFQLAFLAYGPRLLDREPDAGRRFMRAYLEGVRQYREGPTERNLAIASRFTGLDAELLRRTCWASISPDGKVNVQSLLDLQAWYVDAGQLARALPAEAFWNPAFAESAWAAIGAP